MSELSNERIKYLLRGADQEMVHGDYLPNIPERKALCLEALASRTKDARIKKLRDALEEIGRHTEFIHFANVATEALAQDGAVDE